MFAIGLSELGLDSPGQQRQRMGHRQRTPLTAARHGSGSQRDRRLDLTATSQADRTKEFQLDRPQFPRYLVLGDGRRGPVQVLFRHAIEPGAQRGPCRNERRPCA